jgi:hypothetical protein
MSDRALRVVLVEKMSPELGLMISEKLDYDVIGALAR